MCSQKKPFTRKSDIRIWHGTQFEIFPNHYNILNVPKFEQQLIISL